MSEPTLREHLSRIGKIGRGKAKRRTRKQYSEMGKARWAKYREQKKQLARAIREGFCVSVGK